MKNDISNNFFRLRDEEVKAYFTEGYPIQDNHRYPRLWRWLSCFLSLRIKFIKMQIYMKSIGYL